MTKSATRDRLTCTGTLRSAACTDQNGVSPHLVPELNLDVEPFLTFAEAELRAAPPWQSGVCFNPGCGRAFAPTRKWQNYCCRACKQQSRRELAQVGHRLALAMLVWRIHKYAAAGTPEAALVRAARRYVTHVQSAWMQDRARRAADAKGSGDDI
ncbi:hypothetical protein [Roseobacter sp. CCS2]|uniref:hypothetical protein n=1 Tax=Roseobacter sp. CCS2 TaxID=391593 RepID=UPI0000F3C58C|nr:hypothetical protein [Roseobacter sp. CCS2]EBA11772.1 hypothetical protein RCCS2_17626 [Roseobacter sp. CCS2]